MGQQYVQEDREGLMKASNGARMVSVPGPAAPAISIRRTDEYGFEGLEAAWTLREGVREEAC